MPMPLESDSVRCVSLSGWQSVDQGPRRSCIYIDQFDYAKVLLSVSCFACQFLLQGRVAEVFCALLPKTLAWELARIPCGVDGGIFIL